MIEKDNNTYDSGYVHSIIIGLFPENIAIKTRLEGEILVAMSQEMVLEFLNPVASDFLNLVDGQSSLSEIVDKLHKMYEADIKTISSDIVELARDLQRKRIIRLNSEQKVLS